MSGDAFEAVLRFADTWRDKDSQRHVAAGKTRKPSTLTVRATGAATLTEPELRAMLDELEQRREEVAVLREIGAAPQRSVGNGEVER